MRKKYLFITMLFFVSLIIQTSFAGSETEKRIRFATSPALGVFNSTAGFGGTLEFVYQVSTSLPIYAGMETGFLYFSKTQNGVDGNYKLFPFLPTVTYRHVTDLKIIPYIGLGMGFAYFDASFSGNFFGMPIAGSGSTTEFAMLIKPGVEYLKWFFEPKFGFLKDEFLFVGSVGYRF